MSTNLPPGVTEEDQDLALMVGDDLSVHPDSISARTPRDFHELLAALRSLGWEEAHRKPGVYLPEGRGGPSWIRDDGPGWAWGYGAIQFDRVALGEVPELIKKRMGSK
jgi:hypothetical protein